MRDYNLRAYNSIEMLILSDAQSFMKHCLPHLEAGCRLLDVSAIQSTARITFTLPDVTGTGYCTVSMADIIVWANNRKLYNFLD